MHATVEKKSAAPAAAATPLVVPAETVTRFRKGVKQVATLGPKTFNKDMIEKLFLAGVDVFRLNLSHGAEDKVSEYPSPPPSPHAAAATAALGFLRLVFARLAFRSPPRLTSIYPFFLIN